MSRRFETGAVVKLKSGGSHKNERLIFGYDAFGNPLLETVQVEVAPRWRYGGFPLAIVISLVLWAVIVWAVWR